MPPGAVSLDDVDLDQVSVDYVLNCAKKGGMLELSEAIRDYHDATLFPSVNNAGPTDEFFLVTDPTASGSPPRRAPPSVPVVVPTPILSSLSISEPLESEQLEESPSLSKSQSLNSSQVKELTVDDIDDFDDDVLEEVESRRYSRRVLNDASDVVLGLPSFATGITDDDLRETAYEVLLAAAGASGGLIVPSKDKKKEKKSRLMKKLGRSKSEHVVMQSQNSHGLVGLLETMRVQMEISEEMDIRTRRALLSAMVGKVGKRMDTLLIPLELLCCISRTEFSDKKSYIKWQKRQLNMLEEGLVNHPVVGFGESGRKASDLRILLAKIEESESLPSATGDLQRTECLRSLRDIAIPLAERPARGDLTGEICHWADGYHLNVRLYEKLLLSVFDVLDEGKLTEEIEEILELFKSTWRILGITETIHYTCYAWVLFRQFVMTGEQDILQHAIDQLKRIPLKEQRGPQERLHLKSLSCRVQSEKGFQELTFLQSFLLPIQKWADARLTDYHLHFAEGSKLMENAVVVAMVARRLLLEEPELPMQAAPLTDAEQIEMYVSSSIKHAFARVILMLKFAMDNSKILQLVDERRLIIQEVEALSDTTNEHPLALLAEQTRKLLRKDTTMYLPILTLRHRNASAVSASLIHKLYGMKLKPFVDSAEHLTEDVVSVFPAADSLEQNLIAVITSTCQEGTAEAYLKKLNLYKIETISGTLVLRWVNSQLARISAWVERVIQQEQLSILRLDIYASSSSGALSFQYFAGQLDDLTVSFNWAPVSAQQRHGSSIVEVYRIVEETVDQFFALKVPMRPGELSSLFRGIDNAFQVYTKHVLDSLADKEDIIPPVPTLTRYRRESGIKAFVKKELTDPRLPEVRKSNDVNVLTTPTLCVQLNTLYYAISQLNKLEDSILERWNQKRYGHPMERSMEDNSRNSIRKDSFDGSRKDINAAIDQICEFTGTKTIFWDLREPFIDGLYKPNVAQSRLETLVEPLDLVLNQLCDIIVEPLRDRVVTGLLQASLDGLIRVILDGGPSRMFTPADAKLLEEDLEVLKEFFISGGDGLPRGVVENQVARLRQVIKLHGYETRELIEDLKSASEMEMQGGRSKLGADAKTLIRILCHRSDSEASQFLKKQYRIPKSAA
ncbi:UNVERIFIED_CONTAM: protein unc-13 [Sesamum latifolium]|uniref:Protein unc-13 n=1 Tax=Sesamum latifolium TaxID=2727402 RepID=A0AAW2YEG1_9LAMI